MTSTTYDTSHLSTRDRFAYWSDVICDAYLPICCETPDRTRFQGRIILDRLPQLALSHVSGSPQHVTRGKGEISRNSDAYFMLSLQLSGRIGLTQGGRQASLGPGDFAIYSTTEPYDLQCPSHVDQLVLQVSQEALLTRLPHADMMTACAVSVQTSLGAVLSQQIRQYADTIIQQPAVVQQFLQDTLIDVIATGLASVQPTYVDLSRPDHLLLQRARNYVTSNLRDESLDRGQVAKAMGMSARNLGRVFEREGLSISAVIRKARLDAIARDLTDPRFVRMSITEIGCKWGMANAQRLSTLFKETFGQSPREYRRGNLTMH